VVFFDVGGTLLNFSVEPSALFSRILAEHGVLVEPADLYATMREVERAFPVPLGIAAKSEGEYWRAYDARILERLGLAPTQALLEEVHGRFQRELTLDCFPESVEVLRRIRQEGIPLGVISNASHGILGDLERNKIDEFFDHIVYSQAVGAAKPDPRIFREALRLFETSPEATWHVGDNVDADIAGARAVGIHPILVDRDGRHAGTQARTIQDLRGVVELLERVA
jgi:putative hydrolase of the HAD superfamily